MARPMHVLRLIVHARSRQPVLLLAEDGGDRCVPVFLRPPQAEVIAAGRRDAGTALTQDVLRPVVEALGRALESVEISDLREGVYTAELVFDRGTRLIVTPSDALSIAVREGLPIRMADHVLDEVGQPVEEILPPDSPDAAGFTPPAHPAAGVAPADPREPPEQQLRQFREFIDEVTPDDFR
ncbi:bifunctional nuclease family protein [Pseudonocardia sp. C8]|uniref:bifunctional nuclease family protein n=1 Tax=Pseudonocardia sp. C8 TaxID=2762759 RepID=UPI001642D6C8|nr:bifunctional nuclease family protein [Pseudonocardia sp. C8]MBC3194756.1 bifunctional nuclease family protein [Pseudonocardia sp. C8]